MTDELDTLHSDDAPAAPARPCVASLTILFHPDPARVGQRALVLRHQGGRPVHLARSELAFGDSPLADAHLSRAPIELYAADGALRVVAPARAAVKIDGAPATEAVLSRADLERGAILELGTRVVLIAHLCEAGPAARDHGLVGQSPAIEQVRRAIDRVADLEVPVLVRGATGAGKERVAQAIHAASGRSGACVAVNMATLTPALAAAELFGHAKGAFTGASERAPGLFERAQHGTLFLDEVGEIPDEVQPMLLRALESGRIRAVGDRDEREVRVRIVAATDADLDLCVREGRLRAALYQRLRGFEIEVPRLAERRSDVPLLFMHALREELGRTGELSRLERTSASWIDARTMIRLAQHSWPGNVRELRTLVRQIAVASRGEKSLRADAATLAALEGAAAPEVATASIETALAANGWSIGKAARALGITRSALYRRVQEHPELQTSTALGEEVLERASREHEGDLDAMARALRISKRALQLRLRALRK